MAEVKFTCETCKYWQNQNIIGLCRRYPQHSNKHLSEWCGEYSAVRKIVELPMVEMPPELVQPVERQKRKYTRRKDAKTSA